MCRIVVTNNKMVEEMLSDKADVIFLDNASGLKVFEEGRRIASEGGRLLVDPTRFKGYYRSLAFFKGDESDKPDEKSLSMIDQSINQLSQQNGANGKESILAGIYQKKDLNVVKSVLA